MKIIIEEYSLVWPQIFADEKAQLENLLPADARIEHMGSTAVPGLAAKPIIDIMIGLTDFAMADDLVPEVQNLSYEYVAEFETEMPYRRYFRRENDGVRTHHIHMVEIGTEFWQRHLAFRDYLRANSDIADKYAALKRELAARDWQNVDDYADAKTAFIRSSEIIALNARIEKD